MLGNKRGILDYLDLTLFRLAKVGRKRLSDKDGLGVFYDEFFTENDDKVFNSGCDRRKVYKGRILDQVIRQHVGERGAVLDVGCGVGDNLKLMYRENLTFTGLECSANSLARARRVLPVDVELKQGSAEDIPFESSSSDLMMCIEVLEHIPDQYQALREMHRVLKPSGVMVISVPYKRWFPSYYTFMGHFRHYTRHELQHLLNQYGFAVIKCLPNYPRWHRSADYCYMLCRVLTIASSLIGKGIYPHELRLPFTSKTVLDFLFDRIEKIRFAEEHIDYDSLNTSTFVLCKKLS